MKSLPTNIANLQEVCGTRVIYDGKSCIKNIIDKNMFEQCLIY